MDKLEAKLLKEIADLDSLPGAAGTTPPTS